MAQDRCTAPGCGRFVPEDVLQCAHHPPAGPDGALAPELDALREVLRRVMGLKEVETQAPLAARIVGVIVQAARAQHTIGAQGVETILEHLRPTLEELDRMEAATGEEGDTP